MINRATMTGRLTRDVELKYTPSGVAVASFTLAVSRRFKNQDGERESDFISCVMWRKAAENFSNFTHKGALVGIDGHIQTRTYDNKDGKRVYVTEVVADDFSLLEPKGTAPQDSTQSAPQQSAGNYTQSAQNATQAPQKAATPRNSMAPFSDSDKPLDPFASNGKQIDISDDDLPF